MKICYTKYTVYLFYLASIAGLTAAWRDGGVGTGIIII